MTIQPPEISFTSSVKNAAQLAMMCTGLFAALQRATIIKANEIASAPGSDSESRHRDFDAYTHELIRATKSILAEGASISDEAAGVSDALSMMVTLFGGVRVQL